jgi:ubiquinone/menaquinone biosynthesis C-methylase UbiE
MSTYILMRILESVPSRYDKGIRIITLGQLDKLYDRLTSHIKRGQTVLDIGCGTGALTLRAAAKGANVKAIDVKPRMIDVARKRASEADLVQNIEFCEMGVAELGNEEAASYDIVMSGLCFSELTEDELSYTVNEIYRIMKPGGLLLVADEVRPVRHIKKILNWAIRTPLVILAYVLTQTTTHPVTDLPEKLTKSGLLIESVGLNKMENFVELIGRKP